MKKLGGNTRVCAHARLLCKRLTSIIRSKEPLQLVQNKKANTGNSQKRCKHPVNTGKDAQVH